MMRGILLILFVASSSVAAPPDDSALKAAVHLVDITYEGAPPFRMEADFTAHINVAQQGHISWKWLSADHWSQEVSLAGFRQIRVRNGDKLYVVRNLRFTPLRIGQLQELLHVVNIPDKWQL